MRREPRAQDRTAATRAADVLAARRGEAADGGGAAPRARRVAMRAAAAATAVAARRAATIVVLGTGRGGAQRRGELPAPVASLVDEGGGDLSLDLARVVGGGGVAEPFLAASLRSFTAAPARAAPAPVALVVPRASPAAGAGAAALGALAGAFAASAFGGSGGGSATTEAPPTPPAEDDPAPPAAPDAVVCVAPRVAIALPGGGVWRAVPELAIAVAVPAAPGPGELWLLWATVCVPPRGRVLLGWPPCALPCHPRTCCVCVFVLSCQRAARALSCLVSVPRRPSLALSARRAGPVLPRQRATRAPVVRIRGVIDGGRSAQVHERWPRQWRRRRQRPSHPHHARRVAAAGGGRGGRGAPLLGSLRDLDRATARRERGRRGCCRRCTEGPAPPRHQRRAGGGGAAGAARRA